MEKSVLKRVVSLALAVVMMLSVIVILPETANAATKKADKTITGKSKQTVTISDAKCYGDKLYDQYGNVVSSFGTGKTYWIKFTAKVGGYVTFTTATVTQYADSYGEKWSDGEWGLYNNKQKALSSTTKFDTGSSSTSQVTYGIKKGQTYFLNVKAYAGVKITAKFTEVKESSGAKKAKAKTIAKNKKIKGFIAAGSNETDWYKFKTTKSQYVSYTFAPKTNGSLKITLNISGKNVKSSSLNKILSSTYTGGLSSSSFYQTKVPKDTTILIGVTRGDKKSSGFYTIKISDKAVF